MSGDKETAIASTDLAHLDRIGRGKVRDIYAIDAATLLIVATDRLSAYDVVLPDPIPGKGRVLTALSNFWFDRTAHLCPNHLTGVNPAQHLAGERCAAALAERATVARRLTPLPVEAVVRGFLIGSGWHDYRNTGAVCGHTLSPGLVLAEALPEALFTPATKAAAGDHDENIDFDRVVALLGGPLAEQVRATALALYRYASDFAAGRGIIIADTKFEFGTDDGGALYLIDEALTPDSSRFWPAEDYRAGTNPPSFDKQYVRDYLQTLDWDRSPPGPALPDAVIRGTRERYAEALRRLTGQEHADG